METQQFPIPGRGIYNLYGFTVHNFHNFCGYKATLNLCHVLVSGWYKQWTREPGTRGPTGPAFTTLYCTYNS